MSEQQNNPTKWQMTVKLPLLLAGLALVVAAWVFRGKKRSIIAAVLLVLGLGLIVWSESVSKWCEPSHHQFGGAVWGQHAFRDPPGLVTCLKRVYGD